MRWLGLLLACGATAGCGRFGFATNDPVSDDTPPIDGDVVEPPISGFTCNEPQRFSSGGATITGIVATSTPNGQSVFLSDTSGNLAAWTYQNAGGTLTSTAANILIDTEITSTISATSIGSSVVVSAIHGLSTPLGTKLYPRDASTSTGATVPFTEFGADRALATSPSGKLAFANIDAGTNAVMLRRIDTEGGADAPVTVAPATDLASYATIAPAGPGYVVQWNAENASPTKLQVALVDDSFAVVAGPVQANGLTAEGPIDTSVAWAKDSNAYLVMWHEKNGSDDDVWFQLRDSNLAPITVGGVLGSSGCCATATSDGTDFWIAWFDFTTSKLLVSRISPSGVVTPRPVMNSGGTPQNGVMLVNNSQPVLVWIESGGTGPEMWIDPLCP